jgi:signal transduction histidine kinase
MNTGEDIGDTGDNFINFINRELKLQSDSEIIAEVTVSLLQDENDMNRGLILILNDVTQLREMQNRMALQERLASIGQLSSQLVHDLKNSLQAMRGFAEHIRYDLETDITACREHIDIIIKEADALHERMDKINDYAKSLCLDIRIVDVNEVVQSALALLRPEIERRQIVTQMRLHPTPLEVEVDPHYIRDALFNLMLNAVQAMDSGGFLTLITRPLKAGLELVVQDTGKGVPDAIKSKIFTPFFTTKRDIGSGLGLASAHKIVLAHDGQVSFESQAGKGTEFIIRLPKKHRS